MSRLLELSKLTKCSYSLEFNEHKTSYESAEKYYDTRRDYDGDMLHDLVGDIDWSKDIYVLQIYVKTPVGFISAMSNDLEALIDWGIEGAREY